METLVAYLGPKGTFSSEVCEAEYPDFQYKSYQTFPEIIEAVQNGNCKFGLLPISSTTSGWVNLAIQALINVCGHSLGKICPLNAKKIIVHPVELCCVKKRDEQMKANDDEEATTNTNTLIMSHPQVFGQCSNWLQKSRDQFQNISLSAKRSTVDAVQILLSSSPMDEQEVLAICSVNYARKNRHVLKIVAEPIEIMDVPEQNFTRFMVLERRHQESEVIDKNSNTIFCLIYYANLKAEPHAFSQFLTKDLKDVVLRNVCSLPAMICTNKIFTHAIVLECYYDARFLESKWILERENQLVILGPYLDSDKFFF